MACVSTVGLLSIFMRIGGDKECSHSGWISIFTVFLFTRFPGAFMVFRCGDMDTET